MVITVEKSEKHKQNFHIRPNLSDLNTHFQKTVKPFMNNPFIPTEVEKLTEEKKRDLNYPMTSALLVGPKTGRGSEKPTMYSTVINSHPTIIRHEIPQPRGIGVHPAAAGAFSVDSAQTLAEKMPNGSYSTPVQYNEGNSEGAMKGYEQPSFIHKKETKIQESEGNKSEASNTDPAVFLKANMEKDISDFTAQFDNTKDKSERIAALVRGKGKLQGEMNTISKTISSEIKELFMAKEVALKLTNLNNYYTTKIKRDQFSSLKLSDVITIKNLLRDKIHKEIQGLRTASSDYADLDVVNPLDIQIIMKEIRVRLAQ